ncbi:MAG: sigma-70 family RNA polymerase sigma factor [Planctomycetaceae bacterium]
MTDREGSFEAKRLEPAVVAELHARHAEELRAYLLGLLRDSDLAAEVVQATFAKASERGHAAGSSLRAWLFQVAHNEAMDRRRRSAVENRVVRKIAWWKRTEEPPPEQLAGRSEIVERVRRAIDDLPAEQREVVRIRIYEEKTFAEIATQVGAPLGTVLTRMRLATKKLANALRAEFDP